MEEGKISKQERNAMRMEKQILRQSRQSEFVRELMDDMEGRPQEVSCGLLLVGSLSMNDFMFNNWWSIVCWCKIQVRESIGSESRELARYMAKMEKRAQEEEELFIRAPMTKMEKKKEKHLKKSRNGYAEQIILDLLLVFLTYL
jgi:U3 small nucleolar ribonucleoprotein protein LCP5